MDGPIGSKFGEHGRMSSIATAKKLIRKDGNGIVFIDDINRFVEMIYSRYLFRPTFGKEYILKGWSNSYNTALFTKNECFLKIYNKMKLLQSFGNVDSQIKVKIQNNNAFIDFWEGSYQMLKEVGRK